MKKIIETNRLILREFEINDSENFFYLNLDPEILVYHRIRKNDYIKKISF
jgi:ribosomal-protein-alanine N-acetyltransferase